MAAPRSAAESGSLPGADAGELFGNTQR
jgi:hypothetical protein